MKAREDIWKSLGAIVLLFVTLLYGCTSLMESSPSTRTGPDSYRCYHNGHHSPAQRKRNYPFDKATSIEVVSFKGVYGYEFGSIVGEEPKEEILPDTFERIILSPRQIDTFTDILFNYNYSKRLRIYAEDINGCYSPRQAVLFKDESGHTFESMEVCFHCERVMSTLPEYSYGYFCEGKYALLKAFFVELGITYFAEEK
jgi:hypothetical protein